MKKRKLKKLLKKKISFYLGDIIINLDKITEKSKEKKIVKIKFDKLWIHGLATFIRFQT